VYLYSIYPVAINENNAKHKNVKPRQTTRVQCNGCLCLGLRSCPNYIRNAHPTCICHVCGPGNEVISGFLIFFLKMQLTYTLHNKFLNA